MEELSIVQEKWKHIGRKLHKHTTIKFVPVGYRYSPDDIRSRCSGAVDCLREMIREWLECAAPPTWSTITAALRKAGEPQLADNLKARYIPGELTTTTFFWRSWAHLWEGRCCTKFPGVLFLPPFWKLFSTTNCVSPRQIPCYYICMLLSPMAQVGYTDRFGSLWNTLPLACGIWCFISCRDLQSSLSRVYDILALFSNLYVRSWSLSSLQTIPAFRRLQFSSQSSLASC